MTVAMTAMKTISGSAIADTLTGGSSGYDLGESNTGDASPPTYPIFLKHAGTFEVTHVAVNVKAMSGTYGGDYSASSDLTALLAHGDAGYGLQFDFRWNGGDFGTKTTIKTGTGDTFPNRFELPTTTNSYTNSGTEIAASSPIAAEIGPSGNGVLGDRAHMNIRYLTPGTETNIGRRQFDIYFTYNFTT